MNGYICFYRKTRVEVYAKSAYDAQCEAARQLKVKPKDQHGISVTLAEVDGKNVVHSVGELQ